MSLVFHVLGSIDLIEAAAMLPALIVALIYGDAHDAPALFYSMLVLVAVGLPLTLFVKPKGKAMYAREGLCTVCLAWIQLSFFGALPYLFSGFLPNFADALFEAVSGFTTTGATVLPSFDWMPHGIVFWRSFTHWIGGMGVLVLTLALLPQLSSNTSHFVRAESPGPTLSKIVPKMGDSAKILYILYGALTTLEFFVLWAAGMSPYDAAIHSLGTAGTGGFSNYSASIAAFQSPAIEWIITLFMFLFAVNFALYFQVLNGGWRSFFKNEELHWMVGLIVGAIIIITLVISPQMGSLELTVRQASFQVMSIVSTTGYATADFNLWPIAAKMLIFVFLFFGGCVGSTAGGMKIMRVGLLIKQGCREVAHAFQPRKVQAVRFEGKGVEENVLRQTAVFAFVYVALAVVGGFLLSLEGLYDIETNFTAALTCVSNVGPGFGAVGPAGGFAGYGAFSKLVSCVLMLAGRLELFPILALFHPAIWRK